MLTITETINISPTELKNLPKNVRQLITNFKHTKFEGSAKETIELKFVSKEKASEMLAKHLGFYSNDNEQKRDSISIIE